MDLKEEKLLLNELRNGNQKAFEKLFHHYYGNLCFTASRILQDDIAAEEIVQDLFVRLWEKREQLQIDTSFKSYLYRSVKNHCLNFIKHNKIKLKHEQAVLADARQTQVSDDNYKEIDLIEKIEESIESLPEKRRKIFRLSREEGLKYREIAEKLGISIKTVEAQMGLAIKTLREKLKNYTTFFTLFLCFKKNN